MPPATPYNVFMRDRNPHQTILNLSVMRIIEKQMNQAVNKEINWKNSNTQVVNNDGVSEVYLYDNLIALIGDTWMQIFDGGHQTATTKSRLNSLLSEHGCGERVFSQNFEWFLIDNKGCKVKFQSGMMLN